MAKLRPRARIVRTIGDQLISGPEAALIELVKNAYDADSPSAKITIVPPGNLHEGRKPGKIVVADSGHGMSAEDLVDKWFEPATTDKVERRISPNKRRLLGAKGVGRFATARLGRILHLTCASKTPGGSLEVSEIDVDWSDFEASRYLDEVEIPVRSREGKPDESQGVTLEIEELRDPWTEGQLKLLVRELRRLASPQDARESKFQIFLDISGFTLEQHGFDGQALVSGMFGAVQENPDSQLDPTEIRPFTLGDVYHYRVEGNFNDSGAFAGQFINQRADGQTQALEVPAPGLADGEQPCGSIHLVLNVYDREGDAVVDLFVKLGLTSIGRMDARKVLDENIGVGIYRGGFRIRPYGDAETDWLELERKRVQNPSHKLGLNQVWGMVGIEDESISGLVERSSREGLEHNGHFERLKRLIADVMVRAETLRVEFREMVGLSRKQEGDTGSARNQANLQATNKAVASLPPKYRFKIQRALKQESAALKNSLEELEAYQHKLAAQSSIGLVVSQMLHDGRRFLGDINTRSKELTDGASRLLEESAFGNHYRKAFGKNAASIHDSAGHLTKLFRSLDPLASRKRGKPKSLDPIEVLQRCLPFFSDAFAAAGVRVEQVVQEGLPKVTVYEADLMAALLNIVDNAVHWLGTSSTKPRELRISATYSKKWVRIALVNNGPRIDEFLSRNLFKPGFTLKPEGSGLGLAIAREAMHASKGDVFYVDASEQTTFVIEMQRS
jgi:signal transduction histidine kinase